MTVQEARSAPDPSVRQRRLLARTAGPAPSAGSWGFRLGKRLPNAERPRRSWGAGAGKRCGQEARCDLDRACADFWRGREPGDQVGWPRFRQRRRRRDAGRLRRGIPLPPRSLTRPRPGPVRTGETPPRFPGRMRAAMVSRQADRGCPSLAVAVGEARADRQPVDGPVVRIDLGPKSWTVPAVAAQQASPSRKAVAPGDGSTRP